MHWVFLLLSVEAGRPVGTVSKNAGDWRGRAAGRTVRLPTAAANWLVQEGSSSLSFRERGTNTAAPKTLYNRGTPQSRSGRLGGGQFYIDKCLLHMCEIWCHVLRTRRWTRDEPDMELVFKKLQPLTESFVLNAKIQNKLKGIHDWCSNTNYTRQKPQDLKGSMLHFTTNVPGRQRGTNPVCAALGVDHPEVCRPCWAPHCMHRNDLSSLTCQGPKLETTRKSFQWERR